MRNTRPKVDLENGPEGSSISHIPCEDNAGALLSQGIAEIRAPSACLPQSPIASAIYLRPVAAEVPNERSSFSRMRFNDIFRSLAIF